MVSDAESHGPTEIPREAWIEPALDWLDENWKHASEPPYSAVEGAIDAAYPLIRERVCQELAEALRERARDVSAESGLVRSTVQSDARFVERFGNRGGEDG